jgi:hypothetical protein
MKSPRAAADMAEPSSLTPSVEYESYIEQRFARIERRITFWRIMAFIFAALCLVCLWLVAGVVLKFGYRIRWLF